MALELLRRPGFALLGEDTPLVDRRGRILPFPLRLGVRPETGERHPGPLSADRAPHGVRPQDADRRRVLRRPPGQRSHRAGYILVGQRNLGDVSAIVPLASRVAARTLVNNMVIGLGVYQGVEFLLERGWGEVLGKGSWRRRRACATPWRSSPARPPTASCSDTR